MLFRPKEYRKDEFYPSYGKLNVGIVTDVKYNFILKGSDSTEVREELLNLRVIGGFRPTEHYPDRLESSITLLKDDYASASFGWYHARRESLANHISSIKTQNDVNINFGQALSSHITDLDIKYASLNTDESDIQGLYIRAMDTDTHFYQPSTFHRKIEKALEVFTTHLQMCIVYNHFKKWQDFVVMMRECKRRSSIIIQKNVRRFSQRDTLITQRLWKKWWNVQKDFFLDYVDPKAEVLECYNMKGTKVFFTTKFAADRWSDQLKYSLDKIAVVTADSMRRKLEAVLKKWKTSLLRQNVEADQMTLEDLSSSILFSRSSYNKQEIPY